MLFVFTNMGIKMYGRFILDAETKMVFSNVDKIIFWMSLGVFLTYLI
jgi:hypothetical protein